ncbi:MAG: virulence factor [Anaerolineae bacterium]|nr:virulence factor [Anaerolineae bacterium]
MATYEILYWHDIPVQVRAKGANPRERVSVQLSQRFQDAVDAAAMSANLIGTDAYLSMFQWGEISERAGTPQEVAAAVAAELEAQHTEIDWRSTAADLRGLG